MFVLLTLVAGAVAFAVPPPITVADVLTLHERTAVAVMITVTSFGAAGLFVAGVKTFRLKLKVAYNLLASGILLFGVALAQLPVIAFYDWWNGWWAKSGMVIVPFVAATTLIFIGIRQFARLLEDHERLTKYSFSFGLSLAFTILSFAAGHYIARDHAVAGTDFYTAVVGWSAIQLTYAAMLANNVRRRLGSSYNRASWWLFVALTALAASAWHEYIINFFMNTDSWYVAHGLSLLPFLASGFALLHAGYMFYLLSTPGVLPAPLIPVTEAPPQATDRDYIESITLLASLASRPEAIDSLLDTLRVITADLPPGQPLRDAEKARLLATYRKIEDYLVLYDPLRSYNRAELRLKLSPAFRILLES